jgi:hypothetical protein
MLTVSTFLLPRRTKLLMLMLTVINVLVLSSEHLLAIGLICLT